MIRRIIEVLVPIHRTVFVVATTFLAVSGSLVAADPRPLGNWLLTFGAALCMYVGDVCGDIEPDAEDLSRSSNSNRAEARVDMFESRASPFILPMFAFG